MGLARYRMLLTPGGSRVEINDHDVSDYVSSVNVEHNPQGVPTVTLSGAGLSTEIQGEGVVRIIEPPEDEGIPAGAFLAAIDAEELDREVLNGASLGSPGGAEAYLEVLRKWASGEH